MSNRIPEELMDKLDKEMMDMKGIGIDDITAYIIHLTWQYAQKNLLEEQLRAIHLRRGGINDDWIWDYDAELEKQLKGIRNL